MTQHQPLEHDELSARVRQELTEDAPFQKRIAYAKGLIPLGTADLLSTLYYLAGDPDGRVRKEAQQSLRELPESLVFVGVGKEASPKILHFLGTRPYDNHHIYEKVALHPKVSDDTLAHLAEHSSVDRVIEIVAKNEAAVLRSPAILNGLFHNPHVPRSTLERLEKFYQIQKKRSFRDDLPEEARRVAEEGRSLPKPPPRERLSPEQALEREKDILLQIPDDRLHPCFRVTDLLNPEFDVDGLFSLDLVHDSEKELAADEKLPLLNRINRMKMVDRMLLALHGNMEARKFLIRTPSKMIQECVMRNPKITTREIVALIKERATSQNVIEIISRNREWERNYELVHQLCWNPKTPRQFIARVLPRLSFKDVRRLSTSKMIPAFTAAQARNLATRMEKSR